MRPIWLFAIVAAFEAMAAAPECVVLLMSFSSARVANLSSMHSDLLTGPVLKIGEKHYAIPDVKHLTNGGYGAPARLAWKQALAAAREAGPEARALCAKTMGAMVMEYFAKAEGLGDVEALRSPVDRAAKFVIPGGVVVYLTKPASIAEMRLIQGSFY